MGRWSQRRLAGGGITPLNHIIDANNLGGFNATAEYQSNVNAAVFNGDEFLSQPSGTVSNLVVQTSTRTVTITFDDPMGADTSLAYSGTVPGILTPQTINY